MEKNSRCWLVVGKPKKVSDVTRNSSDPAPGNAVIRSVAKGGPGGARAPPLFAAMPLLRV